MSFATSGQIGVALETVDPSPKFEVGTLVLADDGSEWIYVRSEAAITAYSTLWIASDFDASMITPALAVTGGQVGFASTVSCSASGQYFWAAKRGNVTIRLAASCQPAVPLYTTDTAGVLDDATVSASQHQVQGVIALTSNSAASSSVGNIAVVATFPLIRRPAA